MLRSKVRASGLAAELGLGAPGALDKASPTALLSAFQRIPAARKMQAMLAGQR